ncbi:MAG: response regulator [Candidatus Omnitrophota bacterium]
MDHEKPVTNGEKKASILIVDDVVENIKILGNILREKGYRIAVASNGTKALEIAGQILPDLVLLDIVMPEPDGFQVCRQLKANNRTKEIPVIFLSAKYETEEIVKGFELGGVDFITKPFNKLELLARINTQLRLRNAQTEIVRLAEQNAALAVAYTANHEINQPLTVLLGNLEMFLADIDKQTLTERQQKFLSRMERSVKKIQEILKMFTDSTSIHFEPYLGERNMAVFENKVDQ